MQAKTLLATVTAALAAAMTFADVSVWNVTAVQRYPWNGLVDVECTVSGIEGVTNGLKLAVAAVDQATGRSRNGSHFQVERGGEWSDDREVTTNGTYRLLWDARADLGPVVFESVVVRVSFDAHEKVQLWEGGPYWATTNIGAEEPEDYGYYFWWGDTVGYSRKGGTWTTYAGGSSGWAGVTWMSSTGEQMESSPFSPSCPTYSKSVATLQSEGWIVSKGGNYVLAPEHDAAQVQWGGSWRMPTYVELSALNSNCDWTWTTQSGVNGYVVRGRGDFAANSIFLPTAGDAFGDSISGSGTYGGYMSSTPSQSSYFEWFLSILSKSYQVSTGNRDYGISVRPVQNFAE